MKCFYYFKRPWIIAASLSVIGGYSFYTYTSENEPAIFSASTVEAATPTSQDNTQGFSLLEDVKSFDSWAVVTNQANIRTEPSILSPILFKAQPKTWFPILDHTGKWYKIQLGKDQIGWISESMVDYKEKSHQHQKVIVKLGTHSFTGPDQVMETDRTIDSKQDYIPLQVSGNWVNLVVNDTGEVLWIPIQAVTWEYADNAVTNVIKVQSGQLLKGKTIVLDAGHGGKDEGAAGIIKQIKERDINLAVANLVEKKLKAAGADVILTRKTNDEYVSLPDRVSIADQANADLFVSIHQNMFPADPTVKGVNTYYYNSSLSQDLAQKIQSQVMISLYHDRKSERIPCQDGLFVLNQNTRPSVLIEGCYLSNPTELEQSIEPDFQEKLASGIFHGILQYYG